MPPNSATPYEVVGANCIQNTTPGKFLILLTQLSMELDFWASSITLSRLHEGLCIRLILEGLSEQDYSISVYN